MIIILDGTYLDIDKVHSIFINSKDEKTVTKHSVWWNPLTWGIEPTVEVERTYVLSMDYVRGLNSWKFTSECNDHATQLAKFKKIVEQLKTQVDVQNQEMLDKLFEEALNNGGTK